jgi:hypothetical protein
MDAHSPDFHDFPMETCLTFRSRLVEKIFFKIADHIPDHLAGTPEETR